MVVGWLLLLNDSAHALIVGNVPGTVPNTTVNPASYPGWTKGDPGFDNHSVSSGYVYLGDGWVLSARHVGYNPAAGIQFQTASGPVTYKMAGAKTAADGTTLEPGAYYTDYGFPWQASHFFAVSNPASVSLEGGGSLSLSPYTDLQLFRINGDPGLPALTIASQALPNSFVAGNAPELMMIGNSGGRAAQETHWSVTEGSPDVWTVTTGSGDQQGYTSDGVGAKRWGTNRVTDPADVPSSIVSGIVSNTAAVFPLSTGVGAIARDLIGHVTTYDRSGTAGGTTFESQAIGGDSGSAVFYKRNDAQWELNGIISSIYVYEGQPGGTAVYGNLTLMTDLSYYYQNYLHSIKDIIESHPDYSVMGDVNLDGFVTGDGTGTWETDDVTAFVQGWRYNNGTGQGNITSWTKGDMNRDGKTDAMDFLKLRTAFNGQVSGSIAALLFGGAVPEPSTFGLVLTAVGAFCVHRRRRGN